MKTLIVTAHPSSKGFTHQIAEAYRKGREANGHEVEILDLYKTDIKQDFLRFEDLREDSMKPDPLRDAMQAKIRDANDIVFVHPMWWVSPPAIMKNYIDVNFAAHFAFKYVAGKPVGLLAGSTASVFITCDGSIWLYRLIALPFWTIWRFGILGICGLKVKAFEVFDQKMLSTEERRQKFLARVENIARKI